MRIISIMQSVNGAQFLNITSTPLLLPPVANAANVIVPLTSIYASLQLDELDFNIKVLNLIWLLVLYVARVTSFILTEFYVLHIVG